MNTLEISELHKIEYHTGIMLDRLRARLMDLQLILDVKHYPRVYKAKEYLLGNFSVFNSVADHVMVNQYFPVMMIDNLHSQPETICRFVDLTCDSDGEISVYKTRFSDKKYFSQDGYPLSSNTGMVLKGFPVGKIELLDSYVVILLVGGYQDVVEFDHNLIGDLPDLELTQIEDGFELRILEGAQTIQEIVKEMGYIIENSSNPYFDH